MYLIIFFATFLKLNGLKKSHIFTFFFLANKTISKIKLLAKLYYSEKKNKLLQHSKFKKKFLQFFKQKFLDYYTNDTLFKIILFCKINQKLVCKT